MVAQIKDETRFREMKKETNLVQGGSSKREEERDQSGSGGGNERGRERPIWLGWVGSSMREAASRTD